LHLGLYLKSTNRTTTLQEAIKKGLSWKDGEPLTEAKIKSILYNCAWRYRGKWEMNRENKEKNQDELSSDEQYRVVNLPHGAILPTDLLDSVRAKMKISRESKKKAGKNDFIYLISHLLYTASGKRMSGHLANGKGGQYRYYVGDGLRIDSENIEMKVINHLKSLIKNSSKLEDLVLDANMQSQVALTEIAYTLTQKNKLLVDQLKKIDKLATCITDSVLSDVGVSEILKDASKQAISVKNQIETQILALLAQQKHLSENKILKLEEKDLKAYLNSFDKLSRVEQRTFLEAVLGRITLKNDNTLELTYRMRGTELDPNRSRRGKSAHLEELSSEYGIDGGR
jgi:hypothetical protein